MVSNGGKNMILYDISMTIEPDMAVYKNKSEKKPQINTVQNFNDAHTYESTLALDLHTGTHIDMPLHMIPGGTGSDSWPLTGMFSACAVLDFSDLAMDAINEDDLRQKEEIIDKEHRALGFGKTVLLKTRNSLQDGFEFDFVYLTASGAAYLAQRKLSGVGIDALGIERNQPDHRTHKTLLGSGIWILEGLRLRQVPEGQYILNVMPLKISGVEALPARAVLLPESMVI